MYDLFKVALESGAAFSNDLGTHVRRVLTPRTIFSHATKESVRADLVAGLTVAAVIIPNAMAYALLVGLPPQMGLYATLAAAALGVMWGSSAFVITGAVGVVSLLTLTALIPFAPIGSPLFITLAIALALMVGGIQLVAGMLRLGYLARLIPHSVLIGFSTAAALIIASTQVPALLGFSIVQKEHVIDTLFQIVKKIPETHAVTFLVGVGALGFLFALRRLAPRFPAALVLLLAGIAGSSFFSLSAYGVALIGEIPARLPVLEIPLLSFTTIATLVSSAFVIALVGLLETFAIAKSIAKTTRERLSTDKELVGQGMANIGAGIFGGLPVSGSFSASAVNLHAGARSALSAVVVSCAILVALLFLTPLLGLLPKVILAAIVISAVMRLVDIRKMYDAFSLSPAGGATAAITFALAFIFKPDVAVIAGIFIALIFLIHSIMFAKVQEVGFDRELSNTLHPVGVRESVVTLPKLLMVRIESSILYANSEHIAESMRRVLGRHEMAGETPKLFAMSFAGVNDIDLTGIEELGAFFRELRSKNIDIGVIYAKKRERETLRRAFAVVGPVTFLHSIDEVKARYELVMRAGKIKV
ncbi:MAG: SulP family inorganic anion transporter [Minisyncoccia bacterium]